MVYRIKHFGRLPHVPDRRDYSPEKGIASVVSTGSMLSEKGNEQRKKRKFRSLFEEPKKATIPKSTDNEKYDTPIEEQGNWGRCVFYGGSLSALEYLNNMLYGKYIRYSKFYNYLMARIMHVWPRDIDSGAYIRSGLGIMVKVGALQTQYWPDDDDNNFNKPVEGWEGDFADDYETLKYFRLDYPNTSKDGILFRIKNYIYNKFPVMCGFYCPESIDSESTTASGNVYYPAEDEPIIGGHAVMILGYDDEHEITNPRDGKTTKGSFKFRNSWGEEWGSGGYGYLPYDYLMEEKPYLLADEFYTITKAEFLESWKFEE